MFESFVVTETAINESYIIFYKNIFDFQDYVAYVSALSQIDMKLINFATLILILIQSDASQQITK